MTILKSKNAKVFAILISLLALLGLSNDKAQDAMLQGFSTVRGFATLSVQEPIPLTVTLSKTEFENLATTSYTLVADPGDNKVVHLLSIAGYREFSSESWDMHSSLDDKGIGVGYPAANELDVVASFSRGFVTGGATSTTASPSYEIKFPVNYVASPSEALVLKRVLATDNEHTIDGTTGFKFYLQYEILSLP